MNPTPEPGKFPVTGGGISPPGAMPGPIPVDPVPGPFPTPTPHPLPPATAAGSGSVRAADGSTIEWTTAADGMITAAGSAGRNMVIKPVLPPTAPGIVIHAMQMDFSVTGQDTYLTIRRWINETNHVATVEIAGGGSEIGLAITLTGAATGNAAASGNYGATPFKWSGPVDLSANPVPTLAAAGFQSNAFTPQIGTASYFAPACEILAGMPGSAAATTTPAPVTLAQEEGWGEFLAKAAVWGLAGVAAALLTGGSGLLVLGGCFLAGADASMITNDIAIIANQNPEIPEGLTSESATTPPT